MELIVEVVILWTAAHLHMLNMVDGVDVVLVVVEVHNHKVIQ